MQLPPSSVPGAPVQPQKKGGVGNVIRGCILVVVGLVALSCIGIFGAYLFQVWQSNNLLATAKEKQTNGDYAGAVSNLETILADYKSLDAAQEASTLLPQANLNWANALREEGKFEEALNRYDKVSDKALASEVQEGQLETRLDWGDALVKKSQFADAQEQYEQVLSVAEAGTSLGDRARAALPEVYVGLAEEAREAGDVATAFEHLNYVFENYQTGDGRDKAVASFGQLAEPLHALAQQDRSKKNYDAAERALTAILQHTPDTPLATEVQGELPALYFEWGQALASAEEFDKAAEVYQRLLTTYPDSELAAQATTALIDAQVAAITRSGEAGSLPPPQATGNSGGEQAVYDVTNDTVCPIVVLMSGPQSQQVKLDPKANQQVEVTPGAYNIVVKTDDGVQLSSDCQNIIPFTGENTLESGMIYQSSFYIETVEN